MFNFVSSAFVASLAVSAIASPIANPEPEVSTNEANILKRAVNPATANGAYTQAQRDAQRTQLLTTSGEQARLTLQAPFGATTHDGTNFTYQFINNTVRPPTGGTIFLGTSNQWPVLINGEAASAIGFVNPCGLNTPHWHPRANEILTVVQGQLVAGLILENDSGFGNVVGGPDPPAPGPLPFVTANLTNYTGFYFPKGLVHWQFNPTCQPAVFAAAFDSNDPGRAEAAISFFSVTDNNVVMSSTQYKTDALSASDIDVLRAGQTNTAATLIQECARRCNIPFTKREDFEYI